MITTTRHKGFLHSPIYLPDLESYENEQGRFYKTPAGDFQSVTTILGKSLDRTGLNKWIEAIGEAEAKKILVQAGIRGTAIHSLCEKYLMNDPDYKKGAMPVNLMTFNTIKKYLDLYVGTVYGNEVSLWSAKLKTAGRSDLLAGWNGINSIIDFKTARKKKSEEMILGYFIQAACYSLMAEELTGMKFPQIVIVMAVDHEDPQVFVKDRKDYEDLVYKIFCR